jgi:hypothetical protein
MRITQAQLRKIIKEEAARMKGKRMNEGLGYYGAGSAELQTALDAICDGWKSHFYPGDPSMDAAGGRPGRPAWDAQCEAACEDLGTKIEELVMQIDDDLHKGDYGY